MKVVVDFERCEANGQCVKAAPEVFKLNDDDTLDVLEAEPAQALRAKLKEAERRCPRAAITIHE